MSLFGVGLYAASPLDSASTAYEKGEYAKSAEIYEKVAREHGVSENLLLNMGNAYVRAGDYGKAMLCYERSLRLDPSNKEVRENVKYIQSKIEDNNRADAREKKVSVTPEDNSFFSNVKDFIVHRYTSNTWAVWSAVMFVLTCICVALYIFMQEVLLRKVGFFGAMITFGICLVTMIFSIMAAKNSKIKETGVITAYKVTLLSEPYTNAKTNGYPLNRGTRLDILDSDESEDSVSTWYKVRLNSDYIGWIKAGDFEPI